MQKQNADKKKPIGRPVLHASPKAKKAANMVAAREYRARKKDERIARLDLRKPLRSKKIDLSAADPLWYKQPSLPG